MMIKLQSTEPERLGKEDSGGGRNAWTSLGRGHEIIFSGGLVTDGDRSGRDQVRGGMGGDNSGSDN